MAVSGANVYVTWDNQPTDGSATDIFFRRSINSGQSFGDIFDLSGNPGSSGADIVAIGPNVYVAWSQGFFPNTHVFFRRSLSEGQTGTFEDPQDISPAANTAGGAKLAAVGLNVYVSWGEPLPHFLDSDIFFRRSLNQGATFELPQKLTSSSGSTGRRIAASGGNVYLVWNDNALGNYEVYFINSLDSGQTFQSIVNLSDNLGISTNPRMVVNGSNLHIFWQDNTPGNFDIFYRHGKLTM